MRFYRTGDVEDRRAYDIAWVADRDSPVDTINGFIEVYMDARGCKGAWEALVSYVNPEKTRLIQAHRRRTRSGSRIGCPGIRTTASRNVTGVSARAIDVVVEAGDSAPMTPIGINLPNDQAIRETLRQQVGVAVERARGLRQVDAGERCATEFSWSPDEAERAERWGSFASELATNLHEVIGHGSGLVEPSVSRRSARRCCKEQYSALEETRADLVALYFIADPQMVELGLVPADEHRRRRAGRVRRLRAQRAGAAAARARGRRRSRKITCATARPSCTG